MSKDDYLYRTNLGLSQSDSNNNVAKDFCVCVCHMSRFVSGMDSILMALFCRSSSAFLRDITLFSSACVMLLGLCLGDGLLWFHNVWYSII